MWNECNSRLPYEAIFVEPLIDLEERFQNDDSGSGVYRYDEEQNKYFLVGIVSALIHDSLRTNKLIPLDVAVGFREWVKSLEVVDAAE